MTGWAADTHDLRTQLDRDGFAILPDLAGPEVVSALRGGIGQLQEGRNVRRRGSVYGVRDLLNAAPAVRAWATDAARSVIAPLLDAGAFPVRGILFDKTPGANWNVIWHQDLSIAVRERLEVPGFGPWSEKAGVTHVQPSAAISERMLTLRLHLDECDDDNGPLRVLPGSHREGRLDTEAICRWRQRTPEVVCTVPEGGALLMRPLLLHASADARTPRHRRVIHLDYAAEDLPGGLQWHHPQEGL